jgi:hypothetical protein
MDAAVRLSFRDWLDEALTPGPAQQVADRVLKTAAQGGVGLSTRAARYMQGGESEAMRQIRGREYQPWEPQEPKGLADEEIDPEFRQAFADWGEEARLTKEKVREYLKRVDGDLGARDNWMRRLGRYLSRTVADGVKHGGHWFYETAISPDIFVRLFTSTKSWCVAFAGVSRARRQLEAQKAAGQIRPGAYRRATAKLSKRMEQPAAEMKAAWRDFFKFKVYGTLQGHLMWYVMAIMFFSGINVADYETEMLGWKAGVYLLMTLQVIFTVVGAVVPAVGRLGAGLGQLMTMFQPEAFKHGDYEHGGAGVASRSAPREEVTR